MRSAAIWALGQVGGETAAETLIYALEDERDEVRTAARRGHQRARGVADPLGL